MLEQVFLIRRITGRSIQAVHDKDCIGFIKVSNFQVSFTFEGFRSMNVNRAKNFIQITMPTKLSCLSCQGSRFLGQGLSMSEDGIVNDATEIMLQVRRLLYTERLLIQSFTPTTHAQIKMHIVVDYFRKERNNGDICCLFILCNQFANLEFHFDIVSPAGLHFLICLSFTCSKGIFISSDSCVLFLLMVP